MCKKLILVGILLTILAGCSREFTPLATSPDENQNLSLNEAVLNADQEFGFKLFRNLVAEQLSENVIISPFSISTALTMLLNGAAGETADALQTALGFDGLPMDEVNQTYQAVVSNLVAADSGVTMSVANSFWYRENEPIREVFIEHCEKTFRADIFPLDFSRDDAPKIINQWVSDKTNGLIPEIIDRLDPTATVAILINALYFGGEWWMEFPPTDTHADTFRLSDGQTIPCEMMHRFDRFSYADTQDGQFLQNYFKNFHFACIFYLPKEDLDEGDVVQKLNQRWLKEKLEKTEWTYVDVYLPKFHLSFGDDLKNELSDLGLGILFGSEADFSNMTTAGGIWVDQVLHKADVNCNEKGITAAASTAVVMVRGQPHIVMKIDRPFYFFLIHADSGTLLFAGHVTNPS